MTFATTTIESREFVRDTDGAKLQYGIDCGKNYTVPLRHGFSRAFVLEASNRVLRALLDDERFEALTSPN